MFISLIGQLIINKEIGKRLEGFLVNHIRFEHEPRKVLDQ
jgi:hypothetical protein